MTDSSHETSQPHMACSSKSKTVRVRAPTAARVDEGRQVQTSTAVLANRALDGLSSLPRDDSHELLTGTDAQTNTDAAS